jgi:cytochrome c2
MPTVLISVAKQRVGLVQAGKSRRISYLPALPLAVIMIAATSQAALAGGGDPAAGRRVFAICQDCHSLEAGTNETGPSLHRLIGRRSGRVADFDYSEAMSGSRLTWDDATLDRYLADPQALVPGNRMPFDGLPDARDRADLIAYLNQAAGTAP